MPGSQGSARQKLVFLTLESPFPPNGGAHLRDVNLINLLREKMDVEVLCFATASGALHDAAVPPGVKVHRVRYFRDAAWKRAFDRVRPDVQAGFCESMVDALRERAAPGKLLWISRLVMAKYLEPAKKLGYRTILDQHQVETHVLWNNAASEATHLRTAIKGAANLARAAQCSVYEGRVCQRSDAVIATSDLDASRILKLAPDAPVHIIPHMIDCAQYAPLRDKPGKTLFFSGTLNYAPNVEGLAWFVSEILPKLRSTLGSACPPLVVAGSNPSPELRQFLETSGAKLHADPPSLLPLLADAAIVVVPMRSGRSMRFKILEAMAAGRAVVATPRGSDGLLLAPGYDIWIADAADKFTSAILRLLANPSLRAETGLHASSTADARYDWGSARTLIANLLSRIGAP